MLKHCTQRPTLECGRTLLFFTNSVNCFHRILSTLVITIIFAQTNFSPSTSLVPISLNGISRHLQLNRAQMEHVTFTSRLTCSLCPMQCGLQSPVAQPQTCRCCVFFSSSHMMGNHMDHISTVTSLLNTPPFTCAPGLLSSPCL